MSTGCRRDQLLGLPQEACGCCDGWSRTGRCACCRRRPCLSASSGPCSRSPPRSLPPPPPPLATGFYWHLYQDGTISFEARLTGIVSTNSMFPDEQTPQGGEPLWGTRLAPGLNAQIHQARRGGSGSQPRPCHPALYTVFCTLPPAFGPGISATLAILVVPAPAEPATRAWPPPRPPPTPAALLHGAHGPHHRLRGGGQAPAGGHPAPAHTPPEDPQLSCMTAVTALLCAPLRALPAQPLARLKGASSNVGYSLPADTPPLALGTHLLQPQLLQQRAPLALPLPARRWWRWMRSPCRWAQATRTAWASTSPSGCCAARPRRSATPRPSAAACGRRAAGGAGAGARGEGRTEWGLSCSRGGIDAEAHIHAALCLRLAALRLSGSPRATLP